MEVENYLEPVDAERPSTGVKENHYAGVGI
jgi:hypothetical protein